MNTRRMAIGLIAMAIPLSLLACGSGTNSETKAEIRLVSRPARVETFTPTDFVFDVMERGESAEGHAMSVTAERTGPPGSSSAGNTGTAVAAPSSAPNAMMGTHMGVGSYSAEMTFLRDGHYRMEAMMDGDKETLYAFEMDVENTRQTSGGYTVEFGAGPTMDPASGDMHMGEESVFRFLVTRSDGTPATDLAPVIVFVSPTGLAESSVKAEHEGNGRYVVRRSFSSGSPDRWKVRFSAPQGNGSVDVEFSFPVSDHGSHADRLVVMEMHATTMMGGMHSSQRP